MRFVAIITILIIMIIAPITSNAEMSTTNNTWKQLNHTADQILQMTKQEKYEEAKQLLDYFSTQFLALDHRGQGLTMTALRSVSTSFERAEVAVTAANSSVDERIAAVTEFRLVVDALVSEHHPLWLNSETNVMQAIKTMQEAVNREDYQAFQHRMNDFLRHYQIIRPALMIDLQPQHLQRLESQIHYLERFRTDPQQKGLNQHLLLMEEEFTHLYKQVKEDATDPSLLWVIFLIGGTIILSLTYVGWKKYKGEKDKVKVKE
ncbi:sporulation protein YpjB [Halalkalibacterium ligniniphilum]|uniref:sporulation protein YpjB n=1 Tax=Halalkalibacterium ligniniphilum TaxID=1134413 RepID=UPI000344D722|nr:sporulation protein YpjB [Halalkalibacterium ligniniphilum]